MALPYRFETDWGPIAKLIVHGSLKTEPGERVLIHADPTYFPELTEQVRIECARAGVIEVGTMLFNSPALDAVRRRLRRRENPDLRRLEDEALRAVFDLSDIYIWLPTSWPYNLWQTEEVLATWPGRSIHFHWIMEDVTDPTYCRLDASAFRTLCQQYERALFIDYAALTAHQQRLAQSIAGKTIRVTDPTGTDITFKIPADAHCHYGNGNASRAFIQTHARAGSARDREVELPCGALRTVDCVRPEGRLAVPDQSFGGRFVGTLRCEFEAGRIRSITSDYHSGWMAALWERETGDRDRLGEFSIGVNPELRPLPGITEIPYYGYGAGVVRFSLGDNVESGGQYRSSFHLWLFLIEAMVTADGGTIVEAGRLVLV